MNQPEKTEPESWWLKSLREFWGEGKHDLDTRRAAKVACDLAEQAKKVIEALQESGNLAITQAQADVLRERERQCSGEGFTPSHDDGYDWGVLADAGAAYAVYAGDALHPYSQGDGQFFIDSPSMWPLKDKWWKPKNPRAALVKAAALLIAEIEKIDRAAARKPADTEENVGDESHHSHLNGGDL
jgi:hypothetical protein